MITTRGGGVRGRWITGNPFSKGVLLALELARLSLFFGKLRFHEPRMDTNEPEFTIRWCRFVLNSRLILFARVKQRRIQDRPEMDDPAEQEKPENRRQTKLQDRHEQPALKQLPQTRNKETA